MKFGQFLKQRLVDSIATNKNLIAASVLLTVASVALFALQGTGIDQLLVSSTSTPWGVVTALFVHTDPVHIGFNLFYLWLWTVFLIVEHDLLKRQFLSKEQISKRLGFTVILVFASAVASNVIWSIVLNPGSTTFGASGAVFAISAACLVFSLMNIPIVLKTLSKNDLHDYGRMAVVAATIGINILIFLVIFTMVTADTQTFFGFGDPQTNSFAHGTSFLITLIAVAMYDFYAFYWSTLKDTARALKQQK